MGYSSVGSKCKIISVILEIIVFIASIVVGSIVKYDSFEFWIFLGWWFGGTLFICTPFFIAGEIIDQLDRANDTLLVLKKIAEQWSKAEKR